MPSASSRVRRRVAPALVVLAGLLPAGCASGAVPPAAGATPATTAATTAIPTGVPTTVPSALVSRLSPAPSVDPSSAPALTSAPWALVSVAADGRTVVVFAAQGGGCDEPRGMEVAERRDEVEIAALYEHGTPPSGVSCLSLLHRPLWSIRLTEPLGDRALVHAPVGTTP